MSESNEEDDGPYWLDGMTPEEQLAAIDEQERHVRAIWANAPPYLAKAMVGSLAGNLRSFREKRDRIARGLHPTRPTPEERAILDASREDSRRFFEEIAKKPPPAGYKPYRN